MSNQNPIGDPPQNCIVYPNGTGWPTVPPLYPTYPTYPTVPVVPTIEPYQPKDYVIPNINTSGYLTVNEQIYKALNGVVLCEPFKTNVVKKKERNAFATIDQKVTLTGIKVLVGNSEIPTGSTAFVRAEACQIGWGKEVFESEGMLPFIRVPVTEIVYVHMYTVSNGWKFSTYPSSTGVLDCNTVPLNAPIKSSTVAKIGYGG